MGGVSIREAARQIGKSEAALRKAAKNGRITLNADGTVDVEKVRLQLAANTDPVRGGDRRQVAAPAPQSHANFGAGWSQNDASARTSGTFQAARAAREAFEAKLSELKYREAIGEYLRKADVEREYSNLFAAVRERLLSVAYRIAPLVRASESDAAAIAIIDNEVRLALEASVEHYAQP
jgi:hypothetical protein